jgi:hypothetical protein
MCRVHRLRISDSAMQRELWVIDFAFLKAADEVYEEQLKCWNRLVTNIGLSVVRAAWLGSSGFRKKFGSNVVQWFTFKLELHHIIIIIIIAVVVTIVFCYV